MSFDFAPDTIFITIAGSHAHGTPHAGSDVDLRGVCVVPLETRLSLFRSFEQFEGTLEGDLWERVRDRLQGHPTAASGLKVRAETVIFDIAKFLRLCAAANPNALEILFADERDWAFETPAWRRLYNQRRHFLSKKVGETYLGYAMAQLKKIRTHRSWLLNPPSRKPTRKEFGLPEAGTMSRDDQNRIEQAVAEKMRSYGIDDLEIPGSLRIALIERFRSLQCDVLGVREDALDEARRQIAIEAMALPRDVIAMLEAERKYRAAMKHWQAFETWKLERNPKRAELEARHGYDTKHAMHLLRLMRTGLEILRTGELHVRRSDAEELRHIREGRWSFEELLAKAADLEAELAAAARESSLRERVEDDFVDGLAMELMLEERQ